MNELQAFIALVVLIALVPVFLNYFTRNTFIGGLLRNVWDLLEVLFAPLIQPLFDRLKSWIWGSTSGIHGTSRFLNTREKRKLLSPLHNGFSVNGFAGDRLSIKWSQRHEINLAPSGGNKTTAKMIPNVLHCEGSMVINDPDGSIHANTAGYLKQRGVEPIVFNIAQPERGERYNPILRANTPTQIARFADAILQSSLETGGKDSFWNESAKKLLVLLVKALKMQPYHFQNMANLQYLLDYFGTDGQALVDLFLFTDKQTRQQFFGLLSAKDEMLQDIVMTCRTMLKLWDDPAIGLLTATDTLDFERLRKEPTALYLINRETNFDSTLSSLFFTQLFDYLMEKPQEEDQNVTLFLDEAGNFKVPELDKLITVLRRRRVAVQLIVQDLSQFNVLYSKDKAATIFSNCSTKVVFPGLSLETCRMISELMGTQTVRYVDPFQEDKEGQPNISERPRPLMTPDEIFSMQNGVIVLIGNNRPLLTKLNPFYKDPVLKKQAAIEPPILPYYESAQLQLIDLTELLAEDDLTPNDETVNNLNTA